MPRNGPATRRELAPDPVYRSVLVTQVVNKILSRGKRTLAERIVYNALEQVQEKSGGDPVAALKRAVENTRPEVEVKSSRVGGATYQVLDGLTSTAQGTYSFLDKTPPPGADKYRLQITDLNGNITYSSIITIMYGNTSNSLVKTGIVVYPNPASTTLNLSIATGFSTNGTAAPTNITPASDYNVQIANILGAVVRTTSISEQNWQTDVSSLMPGTYVIQVVNKSTDKVVGQSTFVKL